MITLRIEGNGLAQIRQRLMSLQANVRQAAPAAAAALVKGNQRDALAALDRFGRRMPPRKRPRSDGARGPVMAPHYTSSRRVRLFFADVTYSQAYAWQLRAGWRGEGADVLAYKPGGRDVLGISPQSRRDTIDAVRAKVLAR